MSSSGLRLEARGGGFGEITRRTPQQADILTDMTYNLPTLFTL